MALCCTPVSKPTKKNSFEHLYSNQIRDKLLDFLYRVYGIEHSGIAVEFLAVTSGKFPLGRFGGSNREMPVYQQGDIMKASIALLGVLLLMSCTPDVASDLVEAGLKVPELEARTVTIDVNHTARTICVHAVLRNISGVDVNGPFKVAIGITRHVGPSGLISSQEIVLVPANVTIAKAGGEHTTDCSQRELHYRDDDPYAVYDLEVLADVEDVLDEFDDWGNNRFKTEWWTISPNSKARFRIEYELKAKSR